MGVDQIIKMENEDGSITINVTTEKGNVVTDTAVNSCYLDSTIASAIESTG